MFGLGMQELVVILLIVLVVFGANKLPKIGEGLGKGISNFKKSIKSDSEAQEDEGQGNEAGSEPPKQ